MTILTSTCARCGRTDLPVDSRAIGPNGTTLCAVVQACRERVAATSERTYAQLAHEGSAPDYREEGDADCPECGARPGQPHLPTLEELILVNEPSAEEREAMAAAEASDPQPERRPRDVSGEPREWAPTVPPLLAAARALGLPDCEPGCTCRGRGTQLAGGR